MTEKDLPDSLRASWLKAISALQLKNYGYVIQLSQSLLKQMPAFLPARQLARKAAIAKTGGKKPMMSTASFGVMKAKGLLKKDPNAALDAVEKLLESEPYHVEANTLLKEAAIAANLPETASFALETIVEGHPKDTKALHELARHYLSLDDSEKAVEIFNRITAIDPTDLTAVKGGKDAAARASMKRGGWEKEEATYRDLIKDKEAAISMEQQSRVVKSDEMIDQQLAELGAKYEENPENVDTTRRIAELYEQKGDLENAVTWFTYSANLTNNTDANLVRKAADLRVKQFDISIKEYESFLATNPDTPEAEGYREQLETMRRERAALLIAEARKRVERNPTDLNFRFELGEILVQAGDFKSAVPELQKARQNPAVRLRAMTLLGKCFVERSMYDLAAKTLEDAAGELVAMDSTKKEVVYELGLVYDRMGDSAKSIDCMKQIYEIDYGYRDVAERVEGSYGA